MATTHEEPSNSVIRCFMFENIRVTLSLFVQGNLEVCLLKIIFLIPSFFERIVFFDRILAGVF